MPPGTLTVSVISCSNLKSMEWGRNDPYVQLTIGPESAEVQPRRRNTKILKGGGKNPHFMEDHTFRIVPANGLTLDVAVWESDGAEDYLNDRLNGKVIMALDSIFRRAAGEYTVKEYEIVKVGTKKRVVHGSIRLGLSWQPGVASTASADRDDEPPPPMPMEHTSSLSDLTTRVPERTQPRIPSGWKEMKMSDGDVYYVNTRNGEKSWRLPGTEDAAAAAPEPAVVHVPKFEPEPTPQPQPQPQLQTHTVAQSGWYYKDPSGQTQGPYSQTEMKQWIDGGFFPESMMVKAPGAPSWLPLHAIRGLIGVTPPPAPPPAPSPAPVAPTLLAVSCPAGVQPGQKILVTSPTGQALQVEVPAGVTPGMIFHIQV